MVNQSICPINISNAIDILLFKIVILIIFDAFTKIFLSSEIVPNFILILLINSSMMFITSVAHYRGKFIRNDYFGDMSHVDNTLTLFTL